MNCLYLYCTKLIFYVFILLRFAQFFVAPLMDESVAQREVLAVNSEHEKNIPVDQWRIRQIEKSLSKTSHPYNHFASGS